MYLTGGDAALVSEVLPRAHLVSDLVFVGLALACRLMSSLMRWFFLLLLVLNLFYYVWHQQQAPLRVKEVEPMALYQGAQQGLRLLDATDRAKDASRACAVNLQVAR